MKVKALLPFNAFNMIRQEGEVFEIPDADKGVRLDLERLGWVEPIQVKAPKKTKAE